MLVVVRCAYLNRNFGIKQVLKQKSFKTRRISARITEENADRLAVLAEMDSRSMTNILELLIAAAWKDRMIPVTGIKNNEATS